MAKKIQNSDHEIPYETEPNGILDDLLCNESQFNRDNKSITLVMDLPSLLHTLLHDSLRWCIFCRAMLCISEAIAVMRCPSVCPSVTFVDHVKTNKHIFEICSPSGSHTILVFPYQTGWRYSDGNPLTGASNSRGGVQAQITILV